MKLLRILPVLVACAASSACVGSQNSDWRPPGSADIIRGVRNTSAGRIEVLARWDDTGLYADMGDGQTIKLEDSDVGVMAITARDWQIACKDAFSGSFIGQASTLTQRALTVGRKNAPTGDPDPKATTKSKAECIAFAKRLKADRTLNMFIEPRSGVV